VAPVLQVTDLTIRRGGALILDGVNWSVAPGEQWVMLGANGSGKTSLLSALTGYLSPTSGKIAVLGQIFGRSDWRDLRKEVGIVSSSVRQLMHDDEPALTTVASGRYATIGHWGQMPRADLNCARALLAEVEAEHLAERSWAVLSQGERQRVLIARALMAQPRLLILDEPCAGLDPVARERFLSFLDRLAAQKNGPSLVFVTHHVDEITAAFTHTFLLEAGKVVASGTTGRVLTSSNLSRTFGSPLRLRRRGGRYALNFLRG